MLRYALGAAVLLACAFLHQPSLRAEEPAPKLIQDTWHAAYFEGAKAGHVHTVIHQLTRDGVKVLRTTRELSLSVRRYNSVVPLRLEMTSEEKADGKVLSLGLTQFLDKDRKLTTTGTVSGDKLVVRTSAAPGARKVAWNDEALGMVAQDKVFAQRKVKPGDSFHYVSYELALLAPLTVRATVKPAETVDLLGVSKEGKVTRSAAKLLRVEMTTDKVDIGGTLIQLPPQVAWLDKELVPIRHEWEFPGLGKILLYQTTKEAALKEGVAPALLPDLGLNTIVSVKTTLESPYDTTENVYRVTVKGEDDPASAFARDARQSVRNVKGNSFELVVRATPGDKGEKPVAKEEFLESSYFLDSASPRIKKLADRIVGTEDDPLRKARKIERWVHNNMKPSNDLGFATASQVARELVGDCRQHAMLMAALCRAARVPARTAIGLVYARDPGRSPAFIFHMWTEVLIDGKWQGMDPTLGRGSISACHLKVADHSWRDTQTLAPLLPVSRLLGKLSIEVVRSK